MTNIDALEGDATAGLPGITASGGTLSEQIAARDFMSRHLRQIKARRVFENNAPDTRDDDQPACC